MPIVTPPKIVQDALDEFLAPLFKNKPQRKHLANYLTGLMISQNKTVAGIVELLFVCYVGGVVSPRKI